MIEKIRGRVEEECKKKSNIYGMDAFNFHFIPTVKYALLLAKMKGANSEIVEISAWLHDIGSILGDYENHHVSSAEYAGKFLKKLGYPNDKIEKVKHCILTHRARKKIPRETIEAECLASADAMSHFDDMPGLFRLALVSLKKNSCEARDYVRAKLERSWQKLMPEAKEIIRPKYEAMKVLLD